jgi:hypothetical protein
MTGAGYLTLGYAIALGLLWGYAAMIWWQHRSLVRRNDDHTRHP